MIKLYIIFLKIGSLAFGGGYAVIPLIQNFVVNKYKWLNLNELIDLISISQMTPGPIAINSASFVGQKLFSLPGSVIASLGVVTPQFFLMMILGYFLFTKNKKFIILDHMIKGLKIGVVSLILITAIDLFKSCIFNSQMIKIENINMASFITFILSFILYLKKVDLFKIIIISSVLGILLHVIF